MTPRAAILAGLLGLPMLAGAQSDPEVFEKTYAAAETAREQAAELGFEWRDTAELLARAEAAAEQGDYAQAIELAREAELQGRRAVEQARYQAEVWQDAVPRRTAPPQPVISDKPPAATADNFERVQAAAETAREQAAELGFEWRDTAELLARAEAAAEQGDYAQAIELAREAELQGWRAVEQARYQAEVWQAAVPKPRPSTTVSAVQ